MESLALVLACVGGMMVLVGGTLLQRKDLPEPLGWIVWIIFPFYIILEAIFEIKRQPMASCMVLGGTILISCGIFGIAFS